MKPPGSVGPCGRHDPFACQEPDSDVQEHDHNDQHERGGPGELDLRRAGSIRREPVDVERQKRSWVGRRAGKKLRAAGGEDQRGRLPAIRPIARNTPVMIAGSAAGNTTFTTVRHRLAPGA